VSPWRVGLFPVLSRLLIETSSHSLTRLWEPAGIKVATPE
jgi:hypothetical protein